MALVGGIFSGIGPVYGASSSSSSFSVGSSGISSSGKASDAEQGFLDYMKKSPAERFQEAWLKKHGLTKEQFNTLPDDQKQALMAQMKQDLEESIKNKKVSAGSFLDFVA